MLKLRAVERFLGQVVDKDNGITGVMLFDKDGMALAKSGNVFFNGNVYSALLSNIWEIFERQGSLSNANDEMHEMMLCCELGTVVATRVANMLLAVVADGKQPVGQIKLKLYGLATQLKEPLEAVL